MYSSRSSRPLVLRAPALIFALLTPIGCGDDPVASPPAPPGDAGGAGATGGAAGGEGALGGAGGGGGGATGCPEGAPMGDYFGKPLADVTIDGQGPFSFAMDTGAPTTVIDDRVAAAIGGGLHEIQFGGITKVGNLPNVTDLAAFGFDTSGVIGTDLLGSYALSLDYARNRFWLAPTIDEPTLVACDHLEGAPATSGLTSTSYKYIEASIEGHRGWLLVDTGASFGVIRESVFAELNADAPRPSLEGFYTPAAVGTFWAKLSRIGTMTVMDRTVSGILVRTIPDALLPADAAATPLLGVVPSGFFRHFLVTLDYPTERLRLDAVAGDSMVEPVGRYVTGIGIAESTTPPVLVSQVLPGSSAEAQGVQIGDEIVAIDGTFLDGVSPGAWAWGLTATVPSSVIEVSILRDGVPLDFDLEATDLLEAPSL